MISVVILTYNEVTNIERCLASVSWSDDVLILDSGSTDGTQELSTALGARVMFRPWDHFAGQRNYALEHGALKHKWVLHLDADEVVTPELRDEMLRIAETNVGKPGYQVPFRLMLMGQWLKHSGTYPTYQVRFGCRDRLRFHMVGHGQREILAPDDIGTLQGDLIHYNFSKGISEWVIKHARYARDEAVSADASREAEGLMQVLFASDPVERRRSLKRFSETLPLRPLLRFAYLYFWRRGFLDGRVGFRYAMLISIYQWMIDMNRIEKLKGE